MNRKIIRRHGLISCLINVCLAICITYALASIAHSQYVLNRITHMGVSVATSDSVRMVLSDLKGLYAYGIVIATGLSVGWPAMAGVRRLTGASRWLVYPLGGLLVMITIMLAMSMVFPMTPIAPARDAIGIIGQCLAGVLGGFTFAWLQVIKPWVAYRDRGGE